MLSEYCKNTIRIPVSEAEWLCTNATAFGVDCQINSKQFIFVSNSTKAGHPLWASAVRNRLTKKKNSAAHVWDRLRTLNGPASSTRRRSQREWGCHRPAWGPTSGWALEHSPLAPLQPQGRHPPTPPSPSPQSQPPAADAVPPERHRQQSCYTSAFVAATQTCTKMLALGCWGRNSCSDDELSQG